MNTEQWVYLVPGRLPVLLWEYSRPVRGGRGQDDVSAVVPECGLQGKGSDGAVRVCDGPNLAR